MYIYVPTLNKVDLLTYLSLGYLHEQSGLSYFPLWGVFTYNVKWIKTRQIYILM
jgi:hypothetical protein